MSGLYQDARIEAKLDQLLAGGGASSSAAALPTGYISSFVAGGVPSGWLVLDGSQQPSIVDNPNLYALFGSALNNSLDVFALRAAAARQYPDLTANTGTNGWSAEASSSYSATYDAFKAFNGVLAADSATDAWIALNNTAQGFLRLNCPSPHYLARYEITARVQIANLSGDYPPRTFTLQALVDGIWVDLDAHDHLTQFNYGETRVFELDSAQLAKPATAYQLVIPAHEGMVINEFALFTVSSLAPFTLQVPDGYFALPDLSSAPAAFPGGVWAIKAG